MFPYPSGRIHMGHVRNYTHGRRGGALQARRGFNVLHPMGWDAFGMPAENAAIESGVPPGDWTYDNIATMRGADEAARLLDRLEPRVRHLRPGLLRPAAGAVPRHAGGRARLPQGGEVNWDPVDMTVLANEQVIDGKGWRSGALVERRELTQWFFRITDIAEELLDGARPARRWPDKVRLMQENWIGKSRGRAVRLRDAAARPAGFETLEVYTTRPDTLCGASFAAIARRTIRWPRRCAGDPEVAAFIAECRAARHHRGGDRDAPRSRASTPASGASIRSTRPGSCRSRSPTSS